MNEKAYLTFYGERGIIPVRQDTRDMGLHLARRRALYRHLGLQPLTFRNRRVLELGPGTGDNALYVASCAPESYVLVDANPASLKAIAEKVDAGLLPSDRVECRNSDILEYQDDRKFDIVLCEGVIPLQQNPEAFLARVASFVAEDGLLVITTMSAASMLAEICRRVFTPLFRLRFPEEGRLLEELVRFFQPDLRSLPGMSRRHEDWVLDNIVYPWPARCTFTIADAIRALDTGFDALGMSPSFVQDWRWYKSIPQDEKSWNDVALEEYERWGSYLLDYRVQPAAPGIAAAQLDSACLAAIQAHYPIWQDDPAKHVPEFIARLEDVRRMVAHAMPGSAAAISDFNAGLKRFVGGDLEAGLGSFRSWFGRGQQYLSFTRRAA